MIEIWKPIPQYEEKYDVSNQGRIRSWTHSRYGRLKNPRILKPQKTENGYLQIILCVNFSMKGFMVHRLVLSAFIRPPKKDEQCNHKNFKRDDNRLENLEWVTRIQNVRHAYDAGRNGVGEKNSQSKLCHSDILKIRDLIKRGVSQSKIADIFNIAQTQVSHINTKKQWAHTRE